MIQDEEFFNQVISPMTDRMIQTVWRITRNREDTEDAFQGAMESILKKWNRISEHPNPTALILRICIDEANGVLRKKYRASFCNLQEISVTYHLKSTTNISSLLIENEIRDEIFREIANLPEQQSTAVYLRFVEGESYQRISEILECEEAAARQYVSRGKSKLNDRLAHLLSTYEARPKS